MAPNDTPADETLFGTDQSTSSYAAGSAPDAADAGAPPAPRKRAPRRATRKAAAPSATAAPIDAPELTDVQSSTDSATETVAEPATEDTPSTRATAKRAPRKRAPRKTAAKKPVTVAPEAAEALEELVAEVTGAAIIDDSALANLDPADQYGTVSRDDLDGLDDLDDLDDVEDLDDLDDVDDLAAPAASSLPTIPTFSVLFQAPEITAPTATRRRRGAAPVTEVGAEVDSEEIADERPEATERTERTERPQRNRRGRVAQVAQVAHVVEPAAESDTDDTDDIDEQDEATDGDESTPRRSRRRRGGKGRRGRAATDGDDTDESEQSDEGDDDASADDGDYDEHPDDDTASSRRRRRRRRAGSSATEQGDDTPNVSTRVRQPRALSDEPVAVRGSTRLEAKKQRRREGREAGRRRTVITEAEFLARREAVDRVMVVRNKDGRTQMGVLEDGVLVEHYIDQATNVSMAGNIYLGRVQNVLPSMEAAFVDIGKGRNAVLYAGEVNWDAAGLEANQPKRIENALSSGQTVLVQVTKDPIGHKGARLTSQISLPGRYLVYVPNSSMTGISRKLPDTERARLKRILREVVPDSAGVIVRTAAEGASEEELRADVERLTKTWEDIQSRAEASATPKAGKSKGRKKNGAAGSSPAGVAPLLLHGEPDLTVRVIRDVFNEDFKELIVSGEQAWNEIHPYISSVAPDLAERVTKWTGVEDLFTHHRVDEQLAKAMDRKVWLPSGGSLVIDRTEAMTVVDVNTGKFVGSGGNLEETVTKNNIEAAEEIVRQLRLRDIGGIIVIDFIDMVLESNRELVVRRLLECLGRDRTKHQVAEVTSLGLVQMTRKRVGSGLIEVFSETCDHCNGRGFIIHSDPVDRGAGQTSDAGDQGSRSRRGRRGESGGTGATGASAQAQPQREATEAHKPGGPTAAQIAAAAHAAAIKGTSAHEDHEHDHADRGHDDHDHADHGHDESLTQDTPTEVVSELESEPQQQPAADAGASSAAYDNGGGQPEADGHPHAFPEDNGPWGGDDSRHEDAPDATTGGGHVELESDSYDATPEVADAAPEPTPEPAPATSPTRRRRGRVIAPAGPPRGQFGSDPSEPVI